MRIFPLRIALGLFATIFFFSTANAQESERFDQIEKLVTLRADSLVYLREEKLVLAEGNVELRQRAWILLADKLSYSEMSGIVRASGNVALSTPDGELIFAEQAELGRDLMEGDANEVSIRLVNDSRLAARSVALRGDQSFLRYAVYSACRPCEEEISTDSPPIWRIKAFRVERNEGEGVIRYENAILEFFGFPVLYTPFFMHADPTIGKKSGFLPPRFFSSSQLGLGVQLPYFWNLAPSYDLTFAPRFYSDGGALWQGAWRHRTQTGEYNLDAAAVVENRANTLLQDTEEIRGALFGNGRFTPAKKWAWGFNLQTTSDDTFPRRFDLSRETELVSTLFAERVDQNDLLRVNGYYFQGLLEGDIQSQSPIILPLLEYTREFPRPFAGGRTFVEGNLLVLAREKGAQSRRSSASLTWDREFFDDLGSVYEFKAQLRGDIYHVEKVPYDDGRSRGRNAEVIGRLLPTAGLEWRFPLVRSQQEGQMLLEPIAQLLLSPNGGNPSGIPNEDSASFEFDESNLFTVSKFPGLDLWEGGKRLRYGTRATFIGDGGSQGSVLFGQEYRLDNEDSFAELTGLHDHASDYVGFAQLDWERLQIEQRFRLDQKNFQLRHLDVGVSAGPLYGINAGLRYAYLSEDISTTEDPESEIHLRTSYQLDGHWNAYAYLRRDLSEHKLLYNGIGLSYSDECFLTRVEYRNDFRRDRDVGPESTLFFRIALIGLGEWDGLRATDVNEYE